MASSADLNGQPHLHQTETNGVDGPPNEQFDHQSQGPSLDESRSPVARNSGGDSVRVREVLYSDIGLNLLLDRLKQSIATARELASFLGKRSALEEQQAHGLRRLIRATHESLRRPDHRQGSYFRQVDEVNRIHDQLAENGIQFGLSLHQMHDDLNEMAVNMERGRKQWKQTGLQAEGRVIEAISMMEKSKRKYYSLAEDYDRVRTGERTGGFSLRGPRSGAQYEEDLQRKVQSADQEYQSRVQSAAAQRQELVQAGRPQSVSAIQELISECDASITVQLQKFAAFNEKLLLSNAMLIAPINTTKDGSVSHGRGLRDIIQSIDNNQDFNSHMLGSSANLPRPVDIRYEQHPSLSSQQAMPPTAFGQPPAGYGPTQSMPGAFNSPAPQYGSSTPQNNYKQGPQPQPQYPRQDNNISPMGQPGPQHQSPYGDTPQSAHTQQSPSQSQAPPYGAPTQSMDLPMQRPTNQGTPLPLQMKSARPPSGGPMGGPMGGSMSGQVGGPMGGPMGGPISGPMSGSTSGPVGGPMGVPMSNPIGSPISSNMGGPMGGSLGGPPGGLMDGQKSGLMGESAGPPVGGSTGSSLGRLTGPSMDEPTSQSMGGPSSGNIGGVMGAPMGIPMGAPQDAPSSGPTTGPMSRPYQDKSQARPMPGYKALSSQPPSSGLNHQGLPPTRPVFGQHLEVLFQRDEVAVPMIVQQCTIAVDLFGSQVEGIYRVSGSAPHIAALKELFDHDSSRVDFRNPETFFHDVNSVAGLLKQFLRDLPDPLFTEAEYGGFINAARIDEDIGRRDAIHASINNLPDPNYATLRHLVLHLNKLQPYAHINRMTTSNLAICFGPTLMRSSHSSDVGGAAYAVRVVQTILDHALDIFDED